MALSQIHYSLARIVKELMDITNDKQIFISNRFDSSVAEEFKTNPYTIIIQPGQFRPLTASVNRNRVSDVTEEVIDGIQKAFATNRYTQTYYQDYNLIFLSYKDFNSAGTVDNAIVAAKKLALLLASNKSRQIQREEKILISRAERDLKDVSFVEDENFSIERIEMSCGIIFINEAQIKEEYLTDFELQPITF